MHDLPIFINVMQGSMIARAARPSQHRRASEKNPLPDHRTGTNPAMRWPAIPVRPRGVNAELLVTLLKNQPEITEQLGRHSKSNSKNGGQDRGSTLRRNPSTDTINGAGAAFGRIKNEQLCRKCAIFQHTCNAEPWRTGGPSFWGRLTG